MRLFLTGTALVAAVLAVGCGSDSSGGSSNGATISGTIDNLPVEFVAKDVLARKFSINGLEIFVSSQSNGTDDTAIAANERQFKFKIVDVSQVDEGGEFDVGGGNDIFSFDDDENHMLATSGQITFIKIGNLKDNKVEFEFSVGYSSTSLSDEHHANLSGTIKTTVE